MKKIILSLVLAFCFIQISTAQYYSIDTVEISVLNANDINVYVKSSFSDLWELNSQNTVINGNTITINLCYEGGVFDMGSNVETNTVVSGINNLAGNYTLVINMVLFQPPVFCDNPPFDSVTLNFTTPLTNNLVYLTTQNVTKAQVSVYPNPAKNGVNIKSENEINSISVFDIQGRQVQVKIVGATETTLDICNLQQGNYLLKINTDKGIATEKIMKE